MIDLQVNQPGTWMFACLLADGVTPAPGLVFGGSELQICKNGGAWQSFTGTYLDRGDGAYFYTAPPPELNTLGPVGFKVEKSGVSLLEYNPARVVPVVRKWTFSKSEPYPELRTWFFVCVDATDRKTPEPGLSFAAGEIQLTKNGAAFVNFGGTVAEVGGFNQGKGAYRAQALQPELDTPGILGMKVEKAGVDLVLMQVGTIGPAATTGPAGTTTPTAIREELVAFITATIPTILGVNTFDRFKRYKGEKPFREYAVDDVANCFRTFDLRFEDPVDTPFVTTGDVEKWRYKFVLDIAYPRADYSTLGAVLQVLDIDQAQNEDERLLIQVLRDQPTLATWIEEGFDSVRETDDAETVSFLRIEAVYEFNWSMT